MRTVPVILIAVFTALVIAASAVVTSHFGMRDWPTPPMPDTATRLITPTEAAGRVGERAEREPGVDRTQTAVTAPGETRRPRRSGRTERRRGERRRGAAARRDRPASGRARSRRDDETPAGEPAPGTGADDSGDQPAEEPSVPAPTPVAPNAPAEAGVARDDDVIQQPPAAVSDPQDDVRGNDDDDEDDEDDDDRDGHEDSAGDLRRGPARNLLDLLP